MYRSSVTIPANRCAFHQSNIITHFCKYHECLLPLCKQCLPIHRRQHATKKGPMDLCGIDDEIWSVDNKINAEIVQIEQVYLEIMNKLHHNGQLHHQMKKIIISERDSVIKAIDLYYESLCQEIDNNLRRKQVWLQELTEHYNTVRTEMISIVQKLQHEQHLRTVIMWNRLHPEQIVNDIQKQAKREFQPPSMVPCDVQQLITAMSANHRLTILDLHGDMGFSNLEKSLYTLRYGQEASTISNNKHAGISITRESKVSNRLIGSRSTDNIRAV